MLANEWLAEQHADDQRRFQQLLIGSFAAHVLGFAVLAFTPSPDPTPLPEVLRVDLIASLPAPRAAAPAPRPAAPKASIPQLAPKAEPLPPAPPLPKQVVLPKEAPKAVPNKRVVPPAPKRPEPVEYDDAMAQLRNELGEQTPAAAVPDAGASEDVSDADLMATTAPAADAKGGSQLDEEIARWVLKTRRHVRNGWKTPPEFLNRNLTTVVEVELTSTGDVVGTPRVRRPSGDPFYDDNAVRAVMFATPLPPPPSSGAWTFSFTEE